MSRWRVCRLHSVCVSACVALIQDGSEDGYGIDRVTPAGAPVTITRFHSADSNRNADISLLELTRVIELYNVRSGSSRTGAYRLQADTEDGFAPGL